MPLPRLLIFALAVALLTGLPALAGESYDLRDNTTLHADNGILLMERQQYAEAAEEFRAAIRLKPYATIAAPNYNNLGTAYRALKNYPLAIASFQHAVRIQPNSALYYKNLIETYADAGSLSQAQASFCAILKDNPENTEVLFLLGLLYREQNDKEAAKQCFATFLKLEPHSDLADAARSYF